MNAHTPLPLDAPSDPTADHAAWAEGVLRRQSAMLEQLAEAGLRMALAVERSVTEAPAEGDKPVAPTEAAMAFARAARAVRLTALLQSKLVQDLARMRAPPAANDAPKPANAGFDPLDRHKARVEAIVERVAKADSDDEDRLDRLMTETGERLDDEDIYGEVLSRPVGELVSLICRDLGLEPDWGRLAQEARAKAEMDDPRSPFFVRGLTRPPPQAGEAPQRGGGGAPHTPPLEPSDSPGPAPERPLSHSVTAPPQAGEHAGSWIGV